MAPEPPKPQPCPSWCAMRYGGHPAEEEPVHISGALLVRRTVLRLCAPTDPGTGAPDAPYLLVGDAEYTLHEAEALIAGVTQLVDKGRESLLAQQPERALPVLDA